MGPRTGPLPRCMVLLLGALGGFAPDASAQGPGEPVKQEDPQALARRRFAPGRWSPRYSDLTVIQVAARDYGDGYLGDAVDSGGVFGIEYAAHDPSSGLGFEGALFYSSPGGTAPIEGNPARLDLDLFEFYGGGRYTHHFGRGPLAVFGGGGLKVLFGDGDVRTTSGGTTTGEGVDAYGFGGYLHAGFYYTHLNGWVAGLDVRQGIGVELRSDAGDWHANETQFGAFLGWGF